MGEQLLFFLRAVFSPEASSSGTVIKEMAGKCSPLCDLFLDLIAAVHGGHGELRLIEK